MENLWRLLHDPQNGNAPIGSNLDTDNLSCQDKKGHPTIYSDNAILTALMIRSVFHLPLRALQGFLTSLVLLMNIDLPIPNYTRICRRAKSLGQELRNLSQKSVTDLVIDKQKFIQNLLL